MKAPKSAFRPAEGRSKGGFRCFTGISPANIWPKRQIYGPEALLRNMEYFTSTGGLVSTAEINFKSSDGPTTNHNQTNGCA